MRNYLAIATEASLNKDISLCTLCNTPLINHQMYYRNLFTIMYLSSVYNGVISYVECSIYISTKQNAYKLIKRTKLIFKP